MYGFTLGAPKSRPVITVIKVQMARHMVKITQSQEPDKDQMAPHAFGPAPHPYFEDRIETDSPKWPVKCWIALWCPVVFRKECILYIVFCSVWLKKPTSPQPTGAGSAELAELGGEVDVVKKISEMEQKAQVWQATSHPARKRGEIGGVWRASSWGGAVLFERRFLLVVSLCSLGSLRRFRFPVWWQLVSCRFPNES